MSVVEDPSTRPPDSHVHSEWSWDAPDGSMEATCARAVELGLPSVAFTEHADFTAWDIQGPGATTTEVGSGANGRFMTPPPLDVDGYLECLDRCRALYPTLQIYSGVELSEPHWHGDDTRALLGRGIFERVLASVHSAPTMDRLGYTGVEARFVDQSPDQVIRDYLAETLRLIEGFEGFEVLAHIDYPVRYWPRDAAPYEVRDFEEEYRFVLSSLASASKILEVNTRVPLDLQVLRWWHDEGGQAITFASDAHNPDALAHGFQDAMQMAKAAGFRPTSDPYDFWRRE